MNCLATQGHNGEGSQLIQLNNDSKHSQGDRIYSDEGIACTLNAAGNNNWYRIKSFGNIRNGHQNGEVYDTDGIGPCLTACGYKDPIKIIEPIDSRKINVVGNVSTTNYKDDDILDTDGLSKTLTATRHQQKIIKPVLTPDRKNKRQNGRRMKTDGEDMFTLTAQDKHGVYDGATLRKLTPVECERLQGFPDNWTKYGKDGELISDTQRYKCCGNAVTTNVITSIVDEMFNEINAK